MSTPTMYGWFSAKGEQTSGSLKYRTPDGGEVIVTVISESNTKPPSFFGDEVCVGPVTDFLGTAVRAEHKEIIDDGRRQPNIYELLPPTHHFKKIP